MRKYINVPIYKFIFLYLLFIFVVSCKSASKVFGYKSKYQCNGLYYPDKDNQIPALFYMSGKLTDLNMNSFSIEYEFMTSEYREQWPLMLSKLYRIIGVQLYRNGDTYLTVNNQRKTYHLDFRYELNQWYKIKITYSRGKAIVSFNDKIVFKEKLELNTDYPKKAYVLTSCNFSNGICFLGNVRDIKVLTNLKS